MKIKKIGTLWSIFFASFLTVKLYGQVERSDATDFTANKNQKVLNTYDFSDNEDFEFASSGFISDLPKPFVEINSNLIRDYRNWEIFNQAAPDTVNPALWRLAKVQSKTGLFQVSEHVYQVRGMDLANMSILIGDTGYIVVDPFLAAELAEEAMTLVRSSLGDKPVTGVILTHSHTDHYGGVLGVVSAEDADAGKVPVIAPEGFVESITDENVIAGAAMTRRTGLAFGFNLGFGPTESISYGLGPAYETGLGPGTPGMVRPNIIISKEIEYLNIDGLNLEFLNMPDTEAPSELVFYIEADKTLCLAEIANSTLHNVLTLRGAKVRDTLLWADYLTKLHQRYENKATTVFGSHFWPRFGQEKVAEYLSSHRDMYKFLHDQTVRMMNNGMTMREIAEEIKMPKSLQRYWFNKEYYGTFSHNSKAIYQFYLGWYDANPTNLNKYPPSIQAKRYVEAIGGIDKTMELAYEAYNEGDYRWSSELLGHLLFLVPDDDQVRKLQASSFEQMGYQAESAMWRSAYLSAAAELRSGPTANFSAGQNLTGFPLASLLDLAAVRLDPSLAKEKEFSIQISEIETNHNFLLTLKNSVLVDVEKISSNADVGISTTAEQFANYLNGKSLEELEKSEDFHLDYGDIVILEELQSFLPLPLSNFNIMTP